MKKSVLIIILGIILICMSGYTFAHAPLCSCYDNGDGSVTCEGGFSDGSSASGVRVRIEDPKGKIMIKGKMDEDSEFTFDKPSGKYKVVFDAGEGHEIEIDSKDIVE
ncbi:MAG: hypothetical protein PVG39_10435 [Desulfobacteraceae bacterium]|jgi:hypothetical protein